MNESSRKLISWMKIVLSISWSIGTKCISLSNEKFIAGPTLIDLNYDEYNQKPRHYQ